MKDPAPIETAAESFFPIVPEQTRIFGETPPISKRGWVGWLQTVRQELVFPHWAPRFYSQISASLEGERAELIDFHFSQKSSVTLLLGLQGPAGSLVIVHCWRAGQTDSTLAGRRN